MELIKAKYAQIDNKNKTITLLKDPPATNGLDTTIENVSVVIKDNIITVSGDKWDWRIVFHKTPLSDIDGDVVENHLKYWYNSIRDLINKKKTPYVDGWYRLKKNKPFNAKFSQWALYY